MIRCGVMKWNMRSSELRMSKRRSVCEAPRSATPSRRGKRTLIERRLAWHPEWAVDGRRNSLETVRGYAADLCRVE